MSAKHSVSSSSVFTVDRNRAARFVRVPRRRNAERHFLFVISFTCSLGGLLFGYNTGVINGAVSFIEADLQLRPSLVGLVTGSLLVGAAFGAFFGGHFSDKFGRYKVTFVNAFMFIFGTLLSALAPSFEVMLFSRVLLGLAVGCASATVPVFLAELAPSEKRGQMVTRNELMCVTGQLIAFLSNAILGNVWADNLHIWRWMLVLAIVPAFVLLFGTWAFVPESPRWLMASNRHNEAFEVLKSIRTNEEQAKAELEEVQQLIDEDRKLHQNETISQIISERWARQCLFIGLGTALCQQVTGVNAIMFYGTEILQKSGMSNKAALIANISNGLVSLLATFVGIWLLSRSCRRPMLMWAQFGTVIVHLIIAFCNLFMHEGFLKGTVILTLCVVFLAFQQGSISPVTWLILAEIFPLRIRGIGISLTTFVLWLMMSFIGILFPILAESVGVSATFFAFSAFNVFALLFSIFWLPETRGKSLEELEKEFKSEDWEKLKRAGDFNFDENGSDQSDGPKDAPLRYESDRERTELGRNAENGRANGRRSDE
ncbi:hypothetical protein niasHS_002466 [Heterodera schachtii]|uniref:Major facilitator superfamily (MFS) profile domain-containing protein n=1 Tax=Heterodera schachtii TaxID=97005 RepID=A0ABD2KK08_HETSC